MKDELGDRMKSYYENRSKTFLARRTPVIIRLDGKAFHTFTRGFNKPFDEAMQETMKYLCENIQGCVLGYTQSDEITLVLIDLLLTPGLIIMFRRYVVWQLLFLTEDFKSKS